MPRWRGVCLHFKAGHAGAREGPAQAARRATGMGTDRHFEGRETGGFAPLRAPECASRRRRSDSSSRTIALHRRYTVAAISHTLFTYTHSRTLTRSPQGSALAALAARVSRGIGCASGPGRVGEEADAIEPRRAVGEVR